MKTRETGPSSRVIVEIALVVLLLIGGCGDDSPPDSSLRALQPNLQERLNELEPNITLLGILTDRGKEIPQELANLDQVDRTLLSWRLFNKMPVSNEYLLQLWLGQQLCDMALEEYPHDLVLEGSVPDGDFGSLEFDAASFPYVDGGFVTEPLARRVACGVLGMPGKWCLQPAFPEVSMPHPPMSQASYEFHFLRCRYEARASVPESERYEAMNGPYSYDERRFPETVAHVYKDMHLSRHRGATPQGRLQTIVNDSVVHHNGVSDSYLNLIRGDVDFVLADRPPKDTEIEEIRKRGAKLDLRTVARDGLVFIANVLNPVNGLTSEQLRLLYTGDIRKWSPVGGAKAPVCLYATEPGSGTQFWISDVLLHSAEAGPFADPSKVVPERYYADYPPWYPVEEQEIEDVFFVLIRDERGLAATSHFFARYMCVSPLTKILAVDGVEPTNETIADGSYPFVTEIYAVIRKDLPEDHPARKLRDWLLTEEGQAVIGESGYVPVSAGH